MQFGGSEKEQIRQKCILRVVSEKPAPRRTRAIFVDFYFFWTWVVRFVNIRVSKTFSYVIGDIVWERTRVLGGGLKRILLNVFQKSFIQNIMYTQSFFLLRPNFFWHSI